MYAYNDLNNHALASIHRTKIKLYDTAVSYNNVWG